MEITITNLLILVTAGLSLYALNNEAVMDKWIMNPYNVNRKKEYYRFITSGFIHADYMHLIFNMFTFYYFGNMVERVYEAIYGRMGDILYILLYVAGIIVSDIPTYLKNKNNSYYNSLGASGGVSAILFAGILFDPLAKMYLMFIPIPIRAFIFGAIYLIYTYTQSKRGRDGINHDAHLYGALFGMAFTIIIYPQVINHFLNNLREFSIF